LTEGRLNLPPYNNSTNLPTRMVSNSACFYVGKRLSLSTGAFIQGQFLFLESTIEKKIEEFQKALYRHQTSSPEEKLYNPEAMKQFTNKNSPGLFQDLLNCITRSENLSKQRKELQEQRVVSLLLVIAYFR